MLARDFKKSPIDPCLLVRGSLIMVVCTNDVTISGKAKNDIKLPLQSLGNGMSMKIKAKDKNLQSFSFTNDGDFTNFIGT